MGITAGLLVQNALKFMLDFGDVSHYLGYSALKDFFPQYSMKPNPTCNESFCRKMQKLVETGQRPKILIKKVEEVEEEQIIENPFGIEMGDDDEEDDTPLPTPKPKQNTMDTAEVSLDDLMKQMGNLWDSSWSHVRIYIFFFLLWHTRFKLIFCLLSDLKLSMKLYSTSS